MMAQGIAEGALGALQLFQQMSGQRIDRQQARDELAYQKEYDARRLGQIDRELGQRDTALGIDRDNTEIRRGELSIAEAAAAREQYNFDAGISQKDAQGILAFGIQEGFIDPVTNRRTAEFDAALRAGDNRASNFLSQIQGRHPERYAEGFVPDTFDFKSNPGSVRASSTAGGAVTLNATSEANDPVVSLDEETFFTSIENDIIDLISDATGDKALRLVAAKGAAGEALTRAEALQADEEAQALVKQTIAREIYAVSGIQAGREFEAMVASAKTPEERRKLYKALADDFGIELPEFTPEDEITKSDAPSTQPEVILDESTQRFVAQLDRQIAMAEQRTNAMQDADYRKAMEKNLAELYSTREKAIRKSNNATFKSVEDELAEAKSFLESARPGRKSYWQGEVDRLTQQRDAAIKSGVDTPVTRTDGWKQLEADVLTRIEGLSPQEVDDLVDRGLLTFTPETTAALRQRALELEINSLPDIKKLPTKEELAFRAITSVFAEDPTTRENSRREIDNLVEAGFAGMDRYEMEAARNSRISAEAAKINALTNRDAELRQSNQDLTDEAIEFSQKLLGDINEALDGDNPIGAKAAMRKYFPGAIAEINRYLPRKGNPTGDSNALRVLYENINAVVSRTFSEVAEDGLGTTLTDDFVGLFTPSPTGEPADFDLANVRLREADNKLFYVDANGIERGKPVAVGALRNVFPSKAVDLLYAAGKANSALAAARAGSQ
jgi:hypothetical protein